MAGSLRTAACALAAAVAAGYSLGTRAPFMGFNTWNAFFCNYNATDVMGLADVMLEKGYLASGYEVLALDDCWQSARENGTGKIIPDPTKFPDGIEPVITYVTSKCLPASQGGNCLKFGLYSDAGTNTCAGRPGGWTYETIDAETYASWNVSFLKYDNCNNLNIDPLIRYSAMSDALLKAYTAAGKNMTFGACIWGVKSPWEWMGPLANHWRIDDDVQPSWDSILRVLGNGEGLSRFATAGQWNDFDMLEVGNNGLNTNENYAHFALWAIMKSPLLIGTDLRVASNTTQAILQATEIIAVNQDPLYVAGDLVWRNGPNRVYGAPLYDGSRAVVMFNAHTHASQYPAWNITVQFSDLGYSNGTAAVVRDLYARQDLGTFTDSFTGAVPLHGVLALKITPTDPSHRDTTWRPWVTGTWSAPRS